MRRIGFIGTGNIAAPMARFLAGKGHQILVTKRNAKVSAQLQAQIGAQVMTAQEVLDGSDVVFLCLRPHVAEGIIEGLSFRAEHEVVSVMAGISRVRLGALCAPAAGFVQTIPLGYLEKGGCPLAAFGDADLLRGLFEPENPVVPVASEAALNAHFAICAMVPGVLELMEGAAGWLGQRTGDPDAAAFFTTRLMGGFLAAMESPRQGDLARERDALAYEGTISLMMVEGLREGGASDAMQNALEAIGRRLDAAD